MASQSQPRHQGHLDATAGREVVYCHAGGHEWYRDEHGLECPVCGNDVTEIVDPENDVRQPFDSLSSVSTSPDFHHPHYDDSDPDEDDIENHMGEHGFYHRQNVRNGPDNAHFNPNVDVVFERFFDMLQGFGPSTQVGEGTSSSPPEQGQQGQQGQQGPSRVHRTTFRSGGFGGGTASVTIFSGPAFQAPGGPSSANESPLGDMFRAAFANVNRDMGAPDPGDHQRGPPAGFARSLHDILNLINPANAASGDAVYSQEALDRIITNLMDTHPQSNAAPPASDAALQNLDRRTVSQSMLEKEHNVDCSICIDAMKEGETAIFLLCKHWFHEACVVHWLKAHNTCPICRTPIEKGDVNVPGNNNFGDRNRGHGLTANEPPPIPPSERRPSLNPMTSDSGSAAQFSHASQWPNPSSYQFTHHHHPLEFQGNPLDDTGRHEPQPMAMPPQSPGRLAETFRSITTIQPEQQPDRDGAPDRGGRNSPDAAYDTSRLQRRTSVSPTSPRTMDRAEHRARMRQRSPSESSRHDRSDRDEPRQSSHGPMSWLRDRFSGGSNSGSGSRNDRRY